MFYNQNPKKSYRHKIQKGKTDRQIIELLGDGSSFTLLEIAEINKRLVTEPPQTFREACQWMLWYQMAGKMYNMGGSLGRIDQFLFPFYERDKAAGILTDEEAIFHIACHFVQDTSYTQLGGPDETGKDKTNQLSFLALEAAHWLKIPINIGDKSRRTNKYIGKRKWLGIYPVSNLSAKPVYFCFWSVLYLLFPRFINNKNAITYFVNKIAVFNQVGNRLFWRIIGAGV